MGTHTSLAPLCGYAPIVERAFFEIPRNRGKNTTLLASLCSRTKEALIEAMGRALAAVSARDVRGFFAHCGYRTPAQQL